MRISDWSSDVCSSDLAALAGAEASVRARALDMSFTQVRAPIGGRISDRRVDAGNLVAGGEGAQATLLTTINALDPIYFSFDASEALRSEEHTSELQSLMRLSYAVFCLKKKKTQLSN